MVFFKSLFAVHQIFEAAKNFATEFSLKKMKNDFIAVINISLIEIPFNLIAFILIVLFVLSTIEAIQMQRNIFLNYYFWLKYIFK